MSHAPRPAERPRPFDSTRPAAWASALALGLAGLLGVAGCNDAPATSAGGAATAESTGPVVIGHVASMSGPTADFGSSTDHGIRMALAEINDAGGVLGGRKIELVTEDNRSVTPEARTAAQKLISRDRVVALLGDVASSRSLAMAPLAQETQTPMLSPASTNPKVTEVGDYIFRSCFIDSFQGDAIATFAMKDLGLKRFAILYAANSDYSVGLRDTLETNIKAMGGEVVAVEGYQEGADKDFSGQLTKIKAASPEAVFVPGYYTEVGLILQQGRRLGMDMPFLGTDGWEGAQMMEIAGDAANGCYYTNHYAQGQDTPGLAEFADAYRAEHGGPPNAWAVLGYDAMKLMADAIDRAGTTDGPALRDALAATENFQGLTGSITINDRRNAAKPIVVVKIEGGRGDVPHEHRAACGGMTNDQAAMTNDARQRLGHWSLVIHWSFGLGHWSFPPPCSSSRSKW